MSKRVANRRAKRDLITVAHRAGAGRIEPLERRQLLSGTWTALANAAPGSVGTMELLPNGDVITPTDGDGAGNDWAILTPNAAGSYVNGTWSVAAKANSTRLFDSSDVLQNGGLFVAGGEYGNGYYTGEVYNPLTNVWTPAPAQSNGFDDSLSGLIANGDVLITPVAPTRGGYTLLFNPNTNSWVTGPKLVSGNSADEQSWVKLADGTLLTVGAVAAGQTGSSSERYLPATNTWIADATLPVNETDGLGEYGAGTLLPNGNALFIGAGGDSAIYTPSGTTAPGTWVAGPNIPNSLGQDDASAAMLRDGTFLITASPADSYNGPTSLFDYNPATNAYTAVAGPNTYGGAAFLTRMLALPNGDVLYSENGTTLYQYDPGTTALASAVPTITSVAPNANGTLTLTGTNLNGINVGATYGDDAQMDTNYPLVRLTAGTRVYYAGTSNWSSTGVMLGSTSETVTVTLPLGIPAGTYSLVAVANGVPSAATPLTVSTTANNAAPTIATPAAVPAAVAAATAPLSVLGADDGGEPNLTYTWTNTAYPAGATLAGFSANGTNAAKTATAIFHGAGTYTFTVTATDAGGLSVTSSAVSVVVGQTLTSVSVSPSPKELTVGQSAPFTATGYDQFGNPMAVPPVFAWAVTAGGGTVSPAGVYTTPATGTLATVTATTTGPVTLSAAAAVPVVNLPWAAADVGAVTVAGTAYDSATTTTLTDTSSDIYGTADTFQFDYQKVTGDVTITAKLNSVASGSGYVKAGLMVRNTLDAGSAMALEAYPSGGLFEYRTAAAGTAAQVAVGNGATAPQWLRLVRAGTTLTGYTSPDGVTWTQTGTQAITMNAAVYVGLALSSHDTAHSATAVFSNVSVTSAQTPTKVAVLTTPANLTAGQSVQLVAAGYDQNGNLLAAQPAFTWAVTAGGGTVTAAGLYTAPATGGTLATVTATAAGSLSATGTVAVVAAPWTSTDLGTVNALGTAYDSATTTTLTDTSDDIWNQSDDFHFDYQTLTGDGTITARLVSQASASTYVKAGVMIRNSLSNDDVMAMEADPSTQPGGPLFEWRTAATVNAAQTATTGATVPEWLRLVRSGNTVTGYSSSNGTTWTQTGTQVLPLNATVYVGLALSSHSTTALATAVFTNVSVVVAPPTVAAAAAATPNPATGTTTALSALGASGAGAAALTYTWATTTVPAGAAAPAFSANGTNAARATTATFAAAGSYTFTVTIADAAGQTVTSSVAVSVVQTLTTFTVSPPAPTVNDGGTVQFTTAALDQFDTPLSTQPTATWSLDAGSVGTITPAGLYTAPATGAGAAYVRATVAGGTAGTATVTVVPTVIVGTPGNDTIRLVRSGANLLVYVDNPTAPAYTLPYASLGSLAVDTGTGTDAVDVDFSGDGSPVPAGGLSVAGGGGAADSLVFTGTVLSDAATVTATAVTFDGGVVAYSGVAAIVDDGDGGTDTLTQAAQPGGGATLTFNATADDGPSIADALTVAGGTFAFPAPAAGSGVADLLLGSLSVRNGATVAVGTAAAQADRYILTVNALSLAGAGSTLDLGGNDLHLATGTATAADRALAAVAAEVAAGSPFAGAVTGPRITSSAVAANPTQLALGYAVAGPTITSLDGDAVNPTDVLVRPTIFGDANLDGVVDGQDYAAIDAGYLSQGTATPLTGWENGDFNGDGVVDGSDYTLVDNAFNTQPIVATSTAEVAAVVAAKPEGGSSIPTSARAVTPASASYDDRRGKRSATPEDAVDRLNER